MEAPPLNAGDVEKGQSKLAVETASPTTTTAESVHEGQAITRSGVLGYFQSLKCSELTESRGIERVLPEERHEVDAFGYMQMALLWASANLTANNLSVGMLGSSIYGLSFLDSALCIIFGCLLGCAHTAYMSTFGPASGNRTMIIARYTFGWWPSRICVLLNLVIMLGYGMIDCVIGGQLLSAVADNDMSIIVGVIIVAIITWVVTVVGLPLFHIYERYAWIPQAAVLFIMVGSAGPYFDMTLATEGHSATAAGNRLSFLALTLSACSAWAPAGADYYVYYPEKTKKRLTFFLTYAGEGISMIFVMLIGAGIASGISQSPAWSAANEISPGAVIVATYANLGTFGKFCSAIMALGVIANNVPGTYSAALGLQCLGSWPLKVPRMVWNTFGVVIYTVCAAVGRNHLYEIFENFLALMGYWVSIWVVITLQEQLLFRKSIYNWEDWNDPQKLPIGVAALGAFLIGWAGAVISMDQVYFIGPVASMVGDYGADMGIFVGASWAFLVFPPFRWMEKRLVGR